MQIKHPESNVTQTSARAPIALERAANMTARFMQNAVLAGKHIIGINLILFVMMLTGCTPRSYNVQLNDDEGVTPGTEVYLDGKRIGQVTEIASSGTTSGRIAKFVVTDPDAQLRVGVARQERGKMNFSSSASAANASVLEAGAMLPTRMPVANFTRTSVENARHYFYSIYALHPGLTVAGAVMAVLLMVAMLRLFRKVLCLLVVAAIFVSTAKAAPGQTGVFYSRDFLRAEQKSAQELLSDIDGNLDAASHLFDAGLAGAPEHLVRALFFTALVEIRLEGHADRISQLKSSFGYIRTEEQRKYTAAYTDLRRQLQIAELRAATLCKQSKGGTGAMTILQIFQNKEGDYRNLIRAGLSDVTTVLDDCNRVLVQTAAIPKAEPKSQDAGKTDADVARLKREQAGLQAQLTELRLAQEDAASHLRTASPVIVVTNEVRTIVERPTAPPPASIQFVTNTVEKSVTNFVVITNIASALAKMSDSNSDSTTNSRTEALLTNSAAKILPAVYEKRNRTFETLNANASLRRGGEHEDFSKVKLAVVVGGLVLFALVVLLGIMLSKNRQRPVRVILTDGSGAAFPEIELDGENLVVLLQKPLVASMSEFRDSFAAVGRDWFGRAILLPSDGTTLNETVVYKCCRLNVGDSIAQHDSGEKSAWIFGGMIPIDLQAADTLSEITAN